MHKKENIVEYSGIGAVRFTKNRRARNISIRVNETGRVSVTTPYYVSRKQAERFLLSKRDWILLKLRTLKEETDGARTVKDGDVLLVRGRAVKVQSRNGESSAEEALWRLLREEARNYLPRRVSRLAEEGGFEYSGIRIRKMTSRWGSCTHKKGINLNSWLMMLPDHLSDYVILHELVHTVHPNHGPEFWNALDRMTAGRSKELRKELRTRKIMLVYPENQFSGEGD